MKNPSEKYEFVTWDDYIPYNSQYIEKSIQMFQITLFPTFRVASPQCSKHFQTFPNHRSYFCCSDTFQQIACRAQPAASEELQHRQKAAAFSAEQTRLGRRPRTCRNMGGSIYLVSNKSVMGKWIATILVILVTGKWIVAIFSKPWDMVSPVTNHIWWFPESWGTPSHHPF